MLFRGKQITEYVPSDIQSLIDNKVAESKNLDYKREINFDEGGKTDFIFDVASFYNTEGGCMVIGLEEEKDPTGANTGIPILPAVKIAIQNYDQIKLRIDEIIRQTTNPSITGLEFSHLLTVGGSDIFLIGIKKYNTLPTMVTYKNLGRFYRRKASGKYSVDTYELADIFTNAATLEKNVLSFLTERRMSVFNDEFWPGVQNLHGVLIHTVPLNYFNSSLSNFSDSILRQQVIDTLSPPHQQSFSYRYCFEGLHLYQQKRETDILPYNLLFRNGIVETFTNGVFWAAQKDANAKLAVNDFLLALKEQLRKALTFYKMNSIEPPYLLSISFNNAKDIELIDGQNRVLSGMNIKNVFVLPPIILEGDLAGMKITIKGLLDILWQCVGRNECPPTVFDDVFKTLKM